MELWIRSQDKMSLIKISNIQYYFVNNLNTIGTYYDNLKALGTYKTKERALEVLDEINRHIEELYNCKYGSEYDLTQFTYEMPKE